MLEIIDGVEELHSFGIIHRDLHWNNILVPESGPLIICDLQSQEVIALHSRCTTTTKANFLTLAMSLC